MLNDRKCVEKAFVLPSKQVNQNHYRSFFLHFGDVQEYTLRIKKYFSESPGEESCKQGEIIFLFLEVSCTSQFSRATSITNVCFGEWSDTAGRRDDRFIFSGMSCFREATSGHFYINYNSAMVRN